MTENLSKIIQESLMETKGRDVLHLDVTGLSDVMDYLIIVTGTSNRHVKSLANNAIELAKENDFRPIGVEGMETGEWVLVDFGDVVLHVMQQSTRDFYELEKLWSARPQIRTQPAEIS